MTWSVKVSEADIKRLRKIFSNQIRKYEKIARIPKDFAILGQNYAKSIAPNMTGTAIKSIKYNTKNKSTSMIFIDPNVLRTNPNSTASNRSFNYVAYMHYHSTMGRGLKIRSGRRRFMFETRDYLKRKLRRTLQTSLRGEYY